MQHRSGSIRVDAMVHSSRIPEDPAMDHPAACPEARQAYTPQISHKENGRNGERGRAGTR